ncbi:MAG: DUF4276 family protein [Phaeodactylibacter sp.]|nr:DUF4276 family protein [Phaeodactylibacter sp.]
MSFIRLNITAEGQTEERFVKEVLCPHLVAFRVSADVRRVLTSKDKIKSYRGGLLSYGKAKKDIQTWLKEDNSREARFSTMFDLYALPNDFPGFQETQRFRDPYTKVAFLERAIAEDIGDRRFIPYIQLHEFEALVLANPRNLELEYFEHESALLDLEEQLARVDNNPELINEGRETAPSKRIIKLIPEYDKVSVGADIAAINGVEFLKKKCRHFNDWITILENLAPSED